MFSLVSIKFLAMRNITLYSVCRFTSINIGFLLCFNVSLCTHWIHSYSPERLCMTIESRWLTICVSDLDKIKSLSLQCTAVGCPMFLLGCPCWIVPGLSLVCLPFSCPLLVLCLSFACSLFGLFLSFACPLTFVWPMLGLCFEVGLTKVIMKYLKKCSKTC